jgi:hypothetical protein
VRRLRNEIYDRIGQTWWDERSPLNILHGRMTPGRFAYFREVLTRQTTAGLLACEPWTSAAGAVFSPRSSRVSGST